MKRRKVLLSIFSSALLVAPALVGAQSNKSILRVPSLSQAAADQMGQPGRPSPHTRLDRASLFRRATGQSAAPGQQASSITSKPQSKTILGKQLAGYKPSISPVPRSGTGSSAVAPSSTVTVADEGTGSGDINEAEPNDTVAQNVDMPVNIFGTVSKSSDIDSFAFPAFGGEQINVQAFASQIGSPLIADIALFDAAGNLLDEEVGDGINDPLIQLTVPSNGFYVAAMTDADGVGGSHFVYILNIAGGVDVMEGEPNDISPDILPALPVTIFADISSNSDRDFYSFQGIAGETLIADVDAAVFGSKLDAEMNLFDPATGIEYFFNDNLDGSDPRFNIVLPYTGTYVIGVDASGGASSGFYSLNLSLVSGKDAPGIMTLTTQGPKHIQVNGFGFSQGGALNVNGTDIPTRLIDRHDLRGKRRWKTGDVVTVSISPDGRRSNPLIIQ